MEVERLDHVHIYVKDLDKATKRFSELLGTSFTSAITPDNMDAMSDSLQKVQGRGAYSTFGIELLEAVPGSPAARAIEPMEEGLGGLSVKVADLEASIADFRSRGMRFLGTVESGGYKVAWFHPRDCHGVLIELCEYRAENPLAAMEQQR